MLRAFSLPASIRPDTFSYLAMIVGFLAAAGLAGVVIASGKPVPIALTVGAVVGVVLMNFPSLVMWMIIAGTLLITGPLVFYVPAAGQVPWAFSLLGMAMLLIALMHAGLKRLAPDTDTGMDLDEPFLKALEMHQQRGGQR